MSDPPEIGERLNRQEPMETDSMEMDDNEAGRSRVRGRTHLMSDRNGHRHLQGGVGKLHQKGDRARLKM